VGVLLVVIAAGGIVYAVLMAASGHAYLDRLASAVAWAIVGALLMGLGKLIGEWVGKDLP